MKFKPSDDVIFTPLKDNTGVLLRLSDTFFFSMNETGVVIWQAIEGCSDFNHIVKVLINQFSVEKERAEIDAHQFIRELLKENLIKMEKDEKA